MPKFTFNGNIVDDNGFTVRPSDPQYAQLWSQAKQQQSQGAPQQAAMSSPSVGGFGAQSSLTGVPTSPGESFGASGSSSQIFQNAAATADPWAANRGQYQTALNDLMNGGTSVISADPSFQARIAGGQQALERSAAAKGFLGSGNILQALQDYGQGKASEEFGNQFQRLSMLAGVNAGSPTASASILAQQPGFNLQSQGQAFQQGKELSLLPHQIEALKQGNVKGAFEQNLLEQQKREMELAQMRARTVSQAYPQGFLL